MTEMWAKIELMGHALVWGQVTAENGLFRIHGVDAPKEFWVGPGAIYRITPCLEVEARQEVARVREQLAAQARAEAEANAPCLACDAGVPDGGPGHTERGACHYWPF